MRIPVFLLSALLSASAYAEVYKCTEKYGKTIYQNTPCNRAAKEQQLDIKSDPAKEAEARAKLQAIRNEYDARKAAQLERDKELRTQQSEAASIDAARRAAMAQQQQAQAQQRQAQALETQNQQLSRQPYYIVPPTPNPANRQTVIPPAPQPMSNPAQR
ncbi:MAG: DUF4124 domain-containing protein [Gammaproteobacteria bacterium]